jgi:prepilin-type N-terminal cleavage/methylation domain-containing protein
MLAAAAGPRSPFAARPQGYTLIEVMFAVALGVTLASAAAAAAAQGTARLRAHVGLSAIVGRFMAARAEAVRRGVTVAVVFDPCGDSWCLRLVADGNGNGVRRADIASGIDRAIERAWTVEEGTGVLRLTVGQDLPPLAPGEPRLGTGADPVRFGSGDMASFSPLGTATSGSLILSSRSGGAYAVRVLGPTGRVRAMTFEPVQGVWQER